MNTNGNIYTVIYTTLVVVLVAAILATVSQVLAPKQDANVKAETISQMLAAAKFYEKSELDAMGNDKVLDAYRKAAKEAFLIKADGTLDRNLDIENCEIVSTSALKAQNKLIRNGVENEVSIPVVIFEQDGSKVTVIACYGAGLWGPVWGYVAVNEDKTIKGVYFDHESETPGLGAKIKDDPQFRAEFEGKSIVYNGDAPAFSIVKGGVPEGVANAVDAITGATMTCNGLNAALQTWIAAYEPYLNAIQARGGILRELVQSADSLSTAADSLSTAN
ncbi:MAG: NADH:ubiquinone reductase (Na(+)-transporting) subunit C [Candidatus Cryptobacteroides sp.]|nr:NADH:ubiquinone reductase (Na(+)-transporting) subunit C [Bacteroidales bacterium]